MTKFLDYIGVISFIEKIKLYFLDKDIYNSFAEYQVVPPEGIKLAPGASVLYMYFNSYNGLMQQKEVLLTSHYSDYIVWLVPGSYQSTEYVYQQIDQYYVQGAKSNVLILWKNEKFYNLET